MFVVVLSRDLDCVEMSSHVGDAKCVRGAYLFIEGDGGGVVGNTGL